ncbi:unnamed protein product [Danaus chrysippus]|uniref:(African queen) hypothetical protein n=1 Tax=Danaus chrysippus TaxID=151541 RepID=A0A8J2QSV9_9NEOP|nr:unnamed protein product [Danaus chrysippus]
MKTLFILLLICAIQYHKCDDDLEPTVLVKTFPKKVQMPLQKGIKIINARKFNKLKEQESRKAFYKKKDKKVTYTAFPPIGDKVVKTSAEKHYFQNTNVERKPRVKKVLPEYELTVFRNKRSLDNTENNTRTRRRAKGKRYLSSKDKANKVHKKIGRSSSQKRHQKHQEKMKTKRTKDNITYVYKKYKSNKKRSNLRQGPKRSSIKLKYTEKVRNTDMKRQLIERNRKLKRQRSLRNREDRKVGYRRLIAGRDAMIKEYPYVVSIQKGREHWCAGALLNQRLVITTANCIWKSDHVSRMKIRAGTRHMDRKGQVAKIMEVVKHPLWDIRGGPDNDVGLLLLDRNIKFSDSVHGVDLPNRAMWPAFEDVWVTSWGSNRRDGVYDSMSSTLQVYHAMLMSNEQCNNVTMRFGVPVTENFFCVTQTGRRAPCTRDTGAPAVSDGVLWGLASWGIRKLCGTERFPAMFSYLASKSNLAFIANATNYLMSDKRYFPYSDRFVVTGASKSTKRRT